MMEMLRQEEVQAAPGMEMAVVAAMEIQGIQEIRNSQIQEGIQAVRLLLHLMLHQKAVQQNK